MLNRFFCTSIGAIGSLGLALFGKWDLQLSSLLIFIAIDFITGLMVASIFKNSTKTLTGALKSDVTWRGIVKKIITICLVAVAYRIDLLLNVDYVRNAVIIGFSTNEILSIVENAGLMGVPIPEKLTDAIDILRK